MLQKKVCMLGGFGVGKTTLVRRFVTSIFSETYLTTIGVKIDKKTVNVGSEPVTLVLWDIAGEDAERSVKMNYVRGASGYFLVADGTRAETLEVASSIQGRVTKEVGGLPFMLLLNKSDLVESWDVAAGPVESLERAGWGIVRTSAKTGEGVEEAFHELTRRMVS